MIVRELLRNSSAECTEEMPLEQVYALLRSNGSCVVVVDSHAHRVPIGVVTERSICDQLITKGRSPRGLTAANVMSSHVQKVRGSAALGTFPQPVISDPSTPLIVIGDDRTLLGILPYETLLSACRAEVKTEEDPFEKPPVEIRSQNTGWVQSFS